MTMTKLTKEGITLLEHVDAKVSDKYVPIFTSELIKLLEPEFQFIDGTRIKGTSTAHFINLENDTGDKIRIYNSFDRTMALRVDMVSDGIAIPLGVDRLVHIGAKAKSFQDEFAEAKQDILDAVVVARTFKDHMVNTVATPEIAKAITKAIFVFGNGKDQNKGVTEVVNYTDILLDQNISLARYINLSIRSYLTGEYNYTKDGLKLNGRPKNSVLGRIHLENRLVKTLQGQFPEYFL